MFIYIKIKPKVQKELFKSLFNSGILVHKSTRSKIGKIGKAHKREFSLNISTWMF